MRILVVSDTHGNAKRIQEILRIEQGFDALIHCGDIEGEEDQIRKFTGIPCYMCAGNNDWFSQLKGELTFKLDDYRFLVTHGHRYGISLGVEHLLEEARSRNVSVVLFGHTHRQYLSSFGSLTMMNPGSLTYPRSMTRRPGYGIITIDREHDIHFELKELQKPIY